MRIDAHTHWGMISDPFVPTITQEGFIARMDELSIEKALVSSHRALDGQDHIDEGNAEIYDFAANYPQRILPYTVVPPGKTTDRKLIKIHPTLHDAPPSGYNALWPDANANGALILTHTWGGDENCDPELFVPIAKKYPNLKIFLGHSGNNIIGCEASIRAATAAPNIYLELATSWVHLGMIERFVDRVGSSRILFGTDMHFLEPSAAVGRLEGVDIFDEDRQKIFGGNMTELLDQL